ncbi:hypothetical protein ABIB40_000117 [Pedobacter sp. UYP30]|uniref:hypothetical protein n=1 Tax=Pedobacter sp. UYP30 TaxID=1756400 RepID=UPI00339B0BF4
MIKYISYFNLFIGIILLALSNNNKNSLDFLSILPVILFNWITLFHLLKNNLKFKKWHLYLGYTCIFLSILSIIVNVILLVHMLLHGDKAVNLNFYSILTRAFFDLLVVFQVVIAIRLNKRLSQALAES